MSELKEYDAVVNGLETTLLLDAATAKAMGLKPRTSGEKEAPAPANKAVTPPPNKSAAK